MDKVVLMNMNMRILLISCAFIIFVFVCRSLKKSRMKAIDSVFWLFFSFSFVLFGVFPNLAYAIADSLGFISPSNFIFLYVIGILVIRDFNSAIRISQLEQRVDSLVQKLALNAVVNPKSKE